MGAVMNQTLTDFLNKVQSTDERDRAAAANGLTVIMSQDEQRAFLAGYDARTKDVELLCEIVKLLKKQRDCWIEYGTEWVNKETEWANKEIDQLIAERLK